MFEGITPWQIPVYSDGYRPADDDELMNVFYDDIKEDIDPETLRENDAGKLIPPLHGALIKNEQDVHLFERLAFLARRERN